MNLDETYLHHLLQELNTLLEEESRRDLDFQKLQDRLQSEIEGAQELDETSGYSRRQQENQILLERILVVIKQEKKCMEASRLRIKLHLQSLILLIKNF